MRRTRGTNPSPEIWSGARFVAGYVNQTPPTGIRNKPRRTPKNNRTAAALGGVSDGRMVGRSYPTFPSAHVHNSPRRASRQEPQKGHWPLAFSSELNHCAEFRGQDGLTSVEQACSRVC